MCLTLGKGLFINDVMQIYEIIWHPLPSLSGTDGFFTYNFLLSVPIKWTCSLVTLFKNVP